MAHINFVLRQSDEDLACFTIHEGRTLLKLYLDEAELNRLAGEVGSAIEYLTTCRNLIEMTTRNLKKTQFPRKKANG